MGKIKTLSLDLETYSDVDLSKCGVYKYAESNAFEILLFGYAVNSGSVSVVDLASGEDIPREILAALSDPDTTKWAFNANFERVCLSSWLKQHHPEHFTGYSIPEDPAGAGAAAAVTANKERALCGAYPSSESSGGAATAGAAPSEVAAPAA